MFQNKIKYNFLLYLLLLLVVILGVLVFYYPTIKQIPIGTDATTYINDANWITNNGRVPAPYQPTYHGFLAYTAPFTSLNVALLHIFTHLNIIYPLFSAYQLVLIIFLLFSSYLVGKTYSRNMSILFPVTVICSYSIIRLFIGSTVSNLLAFCFINIIYYLVVKYFQSYRPKNLLLILLMLFAIYFTHNYLTAPIFIPSLILYFIIIFSINKKIRNVLIQKSRENKKIVIIVSLIIIVLVVNFLIIYNHIIKEAINSFWKSSIQDKFLGEIPINKYGNYLGPFLYTFAILGILMYALKKDNILSYKVFPLFYLLILFIILQTYLIGINFYFERIVFLAGIFIPFFCAYFIDLAIGRFKYSNKILLTLLSLFIVIITISGVNKVKDLYDKSNNVTIDQVDVLKLLNTISLSTDMIVSNINAVSETNHDIMVSDRTILHVSTDTNKCLIDQACISFNNPAKPESIDFFKKNNIRYVLLLYPNKDGNSELDSLSHLYAINKNFTAIFIKNDAQLFKLN
ncbi:MAG: hypothetical protein WC570_01165 [Patescibacteria group bacterium]